MVKRSRPRHETDEYVVPNEPPSKQPRDVQHTQYEIGDPLSKESRVRTDVTLYHEDNLFTMDDDHLCLMDLSNDEHSDTEADNNNKNNNDWTSDYNRNDDDSTINILEHEFEAAGLDNVHKGAPQNAEESKRQRKPVCYFLYFSFHIILAN